jgi:aldose 1-epimerase
MRYRIETQQRGGGIVYRLIDDQTGASASVLPAFGFNLFDLRLPAAGEVRPVLDAAADWADNPREPGRHGTPILFPFPNRIRDARYSFGGKTYQLTANNGPNAIHGFAIKAPWDVVEHEATDQGATVAGRYTISKQSPEMLPRWPTDAALQIRYTLAGRRLTLEATVSNPTAADLPYGFGIHPYFRLPLAEHGDPARTQVMIPAAEFWELEAFLPTGKRLPVNPRLDFRKGQPMAGLKLDDVLTGLIPPEGGQGDHVCRLKDLDLGAEFDLGFDRNFREIVVYTPPGPGRVIAIEPYTQTTDAINLQARGIDAGLRVLRHGEQQTLRITMETAG